MTKVPWPCDTKILLGDVLRESIAYDQGKWKITTSRNGKTFPLATGSNTQPNPIEAPIGAPMLLDMAGSLATPGNHGFLIVSVADGDTLVSFGFPYILNTKQILFDQSRVFYSHYPDSRRDQDAAFFGTLFHQKPLQKIVKPHLDKTNAAKSGLVFFNRYVPKKITKKVAEFFRDHVTLLDPVRKLHGAIPLLTGPAFVDVAHLSLLQGLATAKTASFGTSCNEFYDAWVSENGDGAWTWVVGRGKESEGNLRSLSNILNATDRNVVMVSGMPGTGKEAFAKAIHYTKDMDGKGRFLTLTARKIEGRVEEGIKEALVRLGCLSSGPLTIFIDELNKANDLPAMLSDLLRITEQSKETLNLLQKPSFIFGSSDYLDDLAMTPPQDFWTRVSQQLHVAHPLGRVTEQDAADFLSAFFFQTWLRKARKTREHHLRANGIFKNKREEFDMWAFPEYDKTVGKWKTNEPECIGGLAHDEVLHSLSALAVNDTLSIRGLRSIIEQIFDRVFAAYVSAPPFIAQPIGYGQDTPKNDYVYRRIINHAVQEVLAVQNAARHTLRTPC